MPVDPLRRAATPPTADSEQPTLVPPTVTVDPRLIWASERTVLAWVRTGIGLMAFGFVLARSSALLRLLPGEQEADSPLISGVGLLMLFLGMAMNLEAARRYLREYRALTRGDPPAFSPRLAAVLAAATAIAGALIAGWVIASL